ncbi:MAG: hypothetical protein K2X35_06870 [Bryobacteraceae bacterium]|nr:hypothetical protein [Bryobacteraceae bacterium]
MNSGSPPQWSEVIAERRLVLVSPDETEVEVIVSFGKPQLVEEGGPYYCPLRIIGLGPEKKSAYGEDSLQALMLAIRMAKATLEHRATSHRGVLRWASADGTGL